MFLVFVPSSGIQLLNLFNLQSDKKLSYANEMTGDLGTLDSFKMGAGHQKMQTQLESQNFKPTARGWQGDSNR